MVEQRNASQHWRIRARRHPSAFLLAAQLLSLLIYPLFDDLTAGRVVFGAFGVLVLALAVWVVNRSPAINWIAWALAAPAFVLSLLSVAIESEPLLVASSALEALLYFYAAGSLIAYMMSDHRVTTDELFAAGATFTLLAWGFAYAFLVCQAWYPGSFTGAVEPERPRAWLELLFLSFTNLSAVGLGDVIPLGSTARVLVMLEQFAGVGYVAVVVSRLIGLTMLRVPPRSRG
ncbi:ion channel [Lysobacter niastensis]|uniref:Two pore domain potassium channel family protein n=1 Tax=Lysobacter niastensis TaxID=380629 RepID=A0ABS0B5P2_9GAMM|nr:ion channel [Lysobacter niastensis]MBF6024205.1 two pore domain potassium channel family protein [Lysobacter niastensis]